MITTKINPRDAYIHPGDIVSVYLYSEDRMILRRGVVLSLGGGPGVPWIILDATDIDRTKYIYEECTITKVVSGELETLNPVVADMQPLGVPNTPNTNIILTA